MVDLVRAVPHRRYKDGRAPPSPTAASSGSGRRRKFGQHGLNRFADGLFGMLNVAAAELLLGPAVPYRAMGVRVENIDRQGPFAVLAHVGVASPIRASPPAGPDPAPAQANIGSGVRGGIGP